MDGDKMAKHYAIADIHGMYNIYEQVCEILNPDDVVYFLGDAGDRGYDCFKTIVAIYNNPQWIYLKGNHEDMMIKAMFNQIHHTDYGDYDFRLWMRNGGYATLLDMQKYCKNNDSSILEWMDKLDRLLSYEKYTNEKGITFHMTHAGFTLSNKWEWKDDLLWNRSHFGSNWNEEKYPNDICIHGHTPIEIMVEKLQELEENEPNYKIGQPEARVYCNGHKINIDNGVFYTGSTVLYDLDEMKAIPLYDKKFMDGEWEY